MLYHSISAFLSFICFLSFYYERKVFAKKLWIPSKKRYLNPLLALLFPWVFAIFMIQSLLLDIFLVASHSMSPFVQQGQFVLVSKVEGFVKNIFDHWEWEESSVILLKSPKSMKKQEAAENNLMVKRILLNTKEEFVIDGKGFLYKKKKSSCNGSVIYLKAEPFCSIKQVKVDKSVVLEWRKEKSEKPAALKCSEHSGLLQCKLEANYYFVVGDNVKNSIDSRSFGLIAKEDVLGRVFALPKII